MAEMAIATSMVSAGVSMWNGAEQKRVAGTEANLMRSNAQYAKDSADEQADLFKEQGDKFLGTAKAGTAKAGLKMEGSPLEALRESEQNINTDYNNIVIGGEVNRLNTMSQASALETQGKEAFAGSVIGAGSTFLGGLGKTGIDYGWWGPNKLGGSR